MDIQQPKPQSKEYKDLIRELEKGIIQIPKFQRNFVWSLEKTTGLLDSILRGYPIGTFILWRTGERINSVKKIGDLELPEPPKEEKIDYILDGQQRIASLYAAYIGVKIQKEGEKKLTDYRNIFVDLEKNINDSDEPIVLPEEPSSTNITLHKLLKFGDDFTEISKNYPEEIVKKINAYYQIFNKYDFSTVILRRDDINSAIDVFTRINTGGQVLTLFEIMCAKTYYEKKNFDMQVKWQNFIIELQESHYNTISSSIILFILALILNSKKECTRSVILKLDKQKIIDKWDSAISSLKKAIDYFRSAYRIPVSQLLPYDALLVSFTYFFFKNNLQEPNAKQSKFLEEFFWQASLSFRYSSAVETKLAQDIKRIDQILENKVQPEYKDIKIYYDIKTLKETDFRAGNSYCKAILCLFSDFEPKEFHNNGTVILDNSWLKIATSKNYHHFFPKAYIRKNLDRESIKNLDANSLMNITFVSAEANIRLIRDKQPSVYIKECSDKNEKLAETLKTHLIEKESFGIEEDNYRLFLEKRAERVHQELKKRIEI